MKASVEKKQLSNEDIELFKKTIEDGFRGKKILIGKHVYESGQRWAKPLIESLGCRYANWVMSEDGLRYRFSAWNWDDRHTRWEFEVDKDGNVSNWKFNYDFLYGDKSI